MSPLPRDLGHGLRLRHATEADAERLAAFNGDILRPQDAEQPNTSMVVWTRDLIGGRHPSFRAGDALLVEDASGAVVSSALLFSHTWSFGGVPVAVGQPELVGTRAELRGRGLVRTLFEELHRMSAARGHELLAINGIPFFYRQFGYEMALELGGGPTMHVAGLASFLRQSPPHFRVRPARPTDIPFIAATDARGAQRYLVTVVRDAALWRYEVDGRSPGSGTRREWRIVETPHGEPVAILEHIWELWGPTLHVRRLEVAPGVSWRDVGVTVLGYLLDAGHEYARRDGGEFSMISFSFLGSAHPIREVFRFTVTDRPYAYYLRVPDLPDFLRRVSPVLERRLAASPLAGHTADLRLSFYRDGVRLLIDTGRLKSVEAWPVPRDTVGLDFALPSADPRRPSAMLPGLTFLQLLFGHRSLEELEAAFPDCTVRGSENRALLNALFPKEPSLVWPVL
jgi:GNAT superfamily N-acetyltransferase